MAVKKFAALHKNGKVMSVFAECKEDAKKHIEISLGQPRFRLQRMRWELFGKKVVEEA